MNRLVVVCLVGAFAMLGCQNYLVGSEGRTIGEYTDDRGIHAVVKVRLIKEADISARRINVDVHEGVVTLYGRVRSESERHRAKELVLGVKGVAKVEDRLLVRP
ncbi:MAG: BON domain-containing protein [Pseudomonadota bacterium]|nr:BON domain-containing protein [Pseudomonadota bacterium]